MFDDLNRSAEFSCTTYNLFTKRLETSVVSRIYSRPELGQYLNGEQGTAVTGPEGRWERFPSFIGYASTLAPERVLLGHYEYRAENATLLSFKTGPGGAKVYMTAVRMNERGELFEEYSIAGNGLGLGLRSRVNHNFDVRRLTRCSPRR